MKLLVNIFIFKFSVQHDILEHFTNEGPELHKQYENAGKQEDWWKKESQHIHIYQYSLNNKDA